MAEVIPSIVISAYLQKWVDGLNRGDDSIGDEAFLPNCTIHINGGPEKDLSRDNFKQMVAGLFVVFPDLQFTINDHFVAAGKATTRWTATGKNTGPIGEIPATGNPVKIDGLIIDRLVDGRVAERWELWDQMGMMQQLGLL